MSDGLVGMAVRVTGTVVSVAGMGAMSLATVDGARYAMSGETVYHEPMLLGLIGLVVFCFGILMMVEGELL